jgi:sugar phosphate permease
MTSPWQQRHSIVAVLFAAYLLCYMDRMAIATAIPFTAKDFQLSQLGMGGVLSAFFIGYAPMQFLDGILADRFAIVALILSFLFVFIAAGGIFTLPLVTAARSSGRGVRLHQHQRPGRRIYFCAGARLCVERHAQ